MNESVCVPKNISRYGVITGHIFLLTSFVAYIKGFTTLKYLALALYLTTVLHWYNLKNDSLIRYIDIIIVIITLSHCTFVDSKKFSDKYRKIWYTVGILIVLVYIMNMIIYNKQVIEKDNKIMDTEDYNYFKLEYTKPESKNRNKSYFYTVLVHLIFLHIIPGIVCISCLIKSDN